MSRRKDDRGRGRDPIVNLLSLSRYIHVNPIRIQKVKEQVDTEEFRVRRHIAKLEKKITALKS